MQITLTEEGYTLDGKWKLVPVESTDEMIKAFDDTFKKVKGMCGSLEEALIALVEASPKPDLSGLHSTKGIHVGGEVLPEFNANTFWCKQCGVNIVGENHLPNCPTLKSKL